MIMATVKVTIKAMLKLNPRRIKVTRKMAAATRKKEISQDEAIKQHFLVVLFLILYKVVATFEFVDENCAVGKKQPCIQLRAVHTYLC